MASSPWQSLSPLTHPFTKTEMPNLPLPSDTNWKVDLTWAASWRVACSACMEAACGGCIWKIESILNGHTLMNNVCLPSSYPLLCGEEQTCFHHTNNLPQKLQHSSANEACLPMQPTWGNWDENNLVFSQRPCCLHHVPHVRAKVRTH